MENWQVHMGINFSGSVTTRQNQYEMLYVYTKLWLSNQITNISFLLSGFQPPTGVMDCTSIHSLGLERKSLDTGFGFCTAWGSHLNLA